VIQRGFQGFAIDIRLALSWIGSCISIAAEKHGIGPVRITGRDLAVTAVLGKPRAIERVRG
jgi:hypothetical protein